MEIIFDFLTAIFFVTITLIPLTTLFFLSPSIDSKASYGPLKLEPFVSTKKHGEDIDIPIVRLDETFDIYSNDPDELYRCVSELEKQSFDMHVLFNKKITNEKIKSEFEVLITKITFKTIILSFITCFFLYLIWNNLHLYIWLYIVSIAVSFVLSYFITTIFLKRVFIKKFVTTGSASMDFDGLRKKLINMKDKSIYERTDYALDEENFFLTCMKHAAKRFNDFSNVFIYYGIFTALYIILHTNLLN